MGSLDIMRLLGEEDIPYDAVWPASSLWLTVGDTEHRIKHAESISITPVVFGIRKSLAEELGFVGREVSVNDLLEAIQSGKLRFCMTSATQSNSGASAYIGFLYALLGNPEVITSEDLQSDELRAQMQEASLRRGPLLRQLGLAEGHVLAGRLRRHGELRVPGHPGQPGTGRARRGAAVCSVPL